MRKIRETLKVEFTCCDCGEIFNRFTDVDKVNVKGENKLTKLNYALDQWFSNFFLGHPYFVTYLVYF